jgi:hypothetical protein
MSDWLPVTDFEVASVGVWVQPAMSWVSVGLAASEIGA